MKHLPRGCARSAAVLAALVLASCALNSEQARSTEVPDAGPPSPPPPPPPTPFQRAQGLWANRLDPRALEQIEVDLAAATEPEELLLRCDAQLMKAHLMELAHHTVGASAAVGLAEKARQDATQAWKRLAPACWGNDGGLAASARCSPVAAAPALMALARIDELQGRLESPVEQMKLLQEQRVLAGRVVELDPLAEGGAPLRLHADALTALPRAVGGDFERARLEYERAIKAYPGSISNRLSEASRWAVMAQDRALFEALLVSASRLDPRSSIDAAPDQLLARSEVLHELRRERWLFRR